MKHSQSESHIDGVKLEAALGSTQTDGRIDRAFQRVFSAERKAMIGSLKCMYFLTKREIAHTTNFVPLCELSKSLGALYLQDLQRGGIVIKHSSCSSEWVQTRNAILSMREDQFAFGF